VRSKAGQFVVLPPKIVEKGSIGSGDCYFAALAHGRLAGLGDTESLRLAAAAGTANAALGALACIGPHEVGQWVAKVSVSEATDGRRSSTST
jgi:fructose-1-phosphate kinase PfkB-like protein